MDTTAISIVYKIADYIIALVLGNFGVVLIKKEYWPAGVSMIVVAFLILYFSSYVAQINKNEEEIAIIKEDITDIKNKLELDERLLNALKDIIILNKLPHKK